MEMAATHTRLKNLQEHPKAVALSGNGTGLSSEGVSLEDINALDHIEQSSNISEMVANVVIEEQAHITIQSGKRCDPSSPGYDMGIPPAIYEEAMQ